MVFFVRGDLSDPLCRALGVSDLVKVAQVVVVSERTIVPCKASVFTVVDPRGTLARAYGLRRPAAGDFPVGYAVVDDEGQIRYRTLDPSMASELSEVRTIVKAAG